jgi:hypothetical protein
MGYTVTDLAQVPSLAVQPWRDTNPESSQVNLVGAELPTVSSQ